MYYYTHCVSTYSTAITVRLKPAEDVAKYFRQDALICIRLIYDDDTPRIYRFVLTVNAQIPTQAAVGLWSIQDESNVHRVITLNR